MDRKQVHDKFFTVWEDYPWQEGEAAVEALVDVTVELLATARDEALREAEDAIMRERPKLSENDGDATASLIAGITVGAQIISRLRAAPPAMDAETLAYNEAEAEADANSL